MRKLRGYLAYCGLDHQLDQLADEQYWQQCEVELRGVINPDMLESHQIVLFRSGELVILVDQPHWAAWLRARQTRILTQLQDAGCRVQQLKISTTPSLIKAGKRPTASITPPPQNAAEIVTKSAESISDPNLKQAMQRLGNKLREKQ